MERKTTTGSMEIRKELMKRTRDIEIKTCSAKKKKEKKGKERECR